MIGIICKWIVGVEIIVAAVQILFLKFGGDEPSQSDKSDKDMFARFPAQRYHFPVNKKDN